MVTGMFRKRGVYKKRWTPGHEAGAGGRKLQHDVWFLTWTTGWERQQRRKGLGRKAELLVFNT